MESVNIGLEDIMRKAGLGTVNENDKIFTKISAFNRLVTWGSIAYHKSVHKTISVSPYRSTVNQIDNIAVSLHINGEHQY